MYGRVKLSWFSLEINIYKVKHKKYAKVVKIPNNDCRIREFVSFTIYEYVKVSQLVSVAHLIVAKLECIEPIEK